MFKWYIYSAIVKKGNINLILSCIWSTTEDISAHFIADKNTSFIFKAYYIKVNSKMV